ncbi:hypothetical protein ACH5RR_033299 [Cinchona calisaya]|uniref:Ankyrin repeat family protein n=1 Tax=Cinchona calisaya TaxID=153742 RepID=A0ABD2YPY6_9GENT
METSVPVCDRIERKRIFACCYHKYGKEEKLSSFNYVYYDSEDKVYHPGFSMEELIERALLHDDPIEFVALINECKSEKDVPEWTLDQMFILDSIKCFTAVLNGETRGKFDFFTHEMFCGCSRPPFLHLAASLSSLEITKWLLANDDGDEANRRCEIDLWKDKLPLNLALEAMRSLINEAIWTHEKSIFRLMFNLCRKSKRVDLEIIRLLARRTDNVWEEFFNYVKNGELVEVVSLLLVARDKVLPIKIPKEKHGLAVYDGPIEFYNFVAKEIAIIDMLQKRSLNADVDNEVMQNWKDKKAVMKMMLYLFWVFEIIGEDLRAFICLDPPVFGREQVVDFACIFKQNGLLVKDRDIYGIPSSVGCGLGKVDKIASAIKDEPRTSNVFEYEENWLHGNCKIEIPKVQQLPHPFCKQQASSATPVSKSYHTLPCGKASKECRSTAQPKRTYNMMPNAGLTKHYPLFLTTLKRGMRYL